MNSSKKRLSKRKLYDLLSEIRDFTDKPVGSHISDEDFVNYSIENRLSDGEIERIDKHLVSCENCAIEMERLLEISSAWVGEKGRKRLAELDSRILRHLNRQGAGGKYRLESLTETIGKIKDVIALALEHIQGQLVLRGAVAAAGQGKIIYRCEPEIKGVLLRITIEEKRNQALVWRAVLRVDSKKIKKVRFPMSYGSRVVEVTLHQNPKKKGELTGELLILQENRPVKLSEISYDFDKAKID